MSITPEEREELGRVAAGLREDARTMRRALRELARSSAVTRRRLVYAFVLGLILTAQLVAFHANRCGVGLGPVSSRARVQTASQIEARPVRAALCDSTFPLLAHTRDQWPSTWNVAGLGGYGVLFGLGAYLARREPSVELPLEEGDEE